jgi:hypothetical protein
MLLVVLWARKAVPYIKCYNVKISRNEHFLIWHICISSWWSGWSSKLFGLLIHQRHGDRAVGSGGFLSYACYCLSLLRSGCVVYVGDASVCAWLMLRISFLGFSAVFHWHGELFRGSLHLGRIYTSLNQAWDLKTKFLGLDSSTISIKMCCCPNRSCKTGIGLVLTVWYCELLQDTG